MEKLYIELQIGILNELYENKVINEKQYKKTKDILEFKVNKIGAK